MEYIKGKVNFEFFLKTIFTWCLVGILISIQYIVFIPPLLIWTLIFDRKDKKVMLWVTRFFLRLFFFLYVTSNFNINLAGIKRARGPRVYILNHASQFDTFLMYLLPGRIQVLVKQSYSKIPFIGWTIRLSGNIMVKKRNDSNNESDVFDEGIKELNNGSTILIFPEGTRSRNGNIGRFKTGGFKMAYQTKAEIVPVVLDTWNSIRPGSGAWIRDDKIWMKVLKIYKYEDYKDIDIKNFAKMMRIKMSEELINIRNIRRKNEKKYYRKKDLFIKLDEEAYKKVIEYKEKNKFII
ncbi:MAG: 1-acyl-sn-glycerol-3-phosphate acyltransferase [Spirochaetes bacterium]|nr:1-acyl-sn-glycerol-3-phosphate acyltransferase [Spirochaetota bacterium]